ncbi:hypothetical protein [Micromonospora sp. DT229]
MSQLSTGLFALLGLEYGEAGGDRVTVRRRVRPELLLRLQNLYPGS